MLAIGLIPSTATLAERDKSEDRIQVSIVTEKGEIVVELDAAKAPNTVANFMRYVEGNFYDGGRFHRTVTMDNQPPGSKGWTW